MVAMAYLQPQSGINVPRIVLRVLRRIDLSPKAFALTTQWDDALASKALNGLGSLDANRLAFLGPEFWWRFSREMLHATLEREAREQIERSA